jgi:hypothetical protein
VIGQVLDASGLDATVIGSVEATSWLITAHAASTPLYLPALAVSEVRSLRPDLLDAIDEVLDHPSAVYRPPDSALRSGIRALLASTGTYDVGAAHAIVVSRVRGWPIITGDVGRLRRLDPDVQVLLI